MKKAMEMLEHLSATREEWEIYDNRMKWLRDVVSAMESKWQEGREEGLGIGAAQAKRDNALRMFQDGLGIQDVARYTDLPEEDVCRIAAEEEHSGGVR